jgi:hypothetical protein
MKKILKSNTYPDDTFAPVIYLMYYDDDFKLFEVKIKLSAEFIQELNAMGVLDGQQESNLIDDIMEHYTILEKNELDITDINMYDIEKEYLDNLNTRITIERYNKMYLLRLDNIKQLKRQKNLRDLGI